MKDIFNSPKIKTLKAVNIRLVSGESVRHSIFKIIWSLFHPFFKSIKLYKRMYWYKCICTKKDKTNNLTMNSPFTVTVTGSSGSVWPVSQKWSILNNTSLSSIKSSLGVFLKKNASLWKFSLSHHVWYICLSVSSRFTEDAVCLELGLVWGLVPVVPRAPGRE